MTDVNNTHPFTVLEHTGWQTAAAHYEQTFALLSSQFASTLLDAMALDQTTRLLDVACGPGTLTSLAAARVGEVVGVDFSAAMLEQACLHNPTIMFKQADVTSLPFADGTFDAAVSNFGVNHFTYPVRALSELRRVLKTQGRFAFTIWAEPKVNIAWRIVFVAIKQSGGDTVALPSPPGGSVNQQATVIRILSESGFDANSIELRLVTRYWQLSSADALLKTLSTGTVRMAALIKAQTVSKMPNIRQAIVHALADYYEQDRYRVPVAAYLASARK